MPLHAFARFFAKENASSLLLLAAVAIALFFANSEWANFYHAILNSVFGFSYGGFVLKLSVEHWINEVLMVLFFLLVGLEIKREFLQGELSQIKKAVLPVICAVGGVIVPALVFTLINRHEEVNWRGWAIPTATDIAFALGLLALGGRGVPLSLKVFLAALAIIDDLIAILVIALYYGEPLRIDPFLIAVGLMFALITLNLMRVRQIWPYALVGLFLWYAVLQSGLHATLAGVLLAATIPVGNYKPASPLHRLEEILHPISAFFVMPVFALANAGLSFAGLNLSDMLRPLPLGIAAGLFVGKQVGIMLAARITTYLGWAEMPQGATRLQFYAVSCLAGVGFTMSLFIGALAFTSHAVGNYVRLGVIGGSLISAVAGLGLLQLAGRGKDK